MRHSNFMALLAVILIGLTLLPPSQVFAITIKEEQELSREMMRLISKSFEFVRDPVITDYVNRVGQRLLAAGEPQPFDFKFYVIKADSYNAFATPGGRIFLHTGLMAVMENEQELAGIMGHEIAHATCRHISQKIDRSKRMNLVTLAGLAAAAVLGAGGASALASATSMGTLAAGQSMALAFSREDEVQADQIGLKQLTEAGYDATGLLSMLRKIRAKQWFGSETIPTYMTTHPAVEDRLINIGTAISSGTGTTKHPAAIDPLEFARAHTVLVAKYCQKSMALKQFSAAVAADPDDSMANFGYGMILARVDKRLEAIEHLQKALEKSPPDAYLLRELGQVYFEDGQYDLALNTLDSALALDARDTGTLLLRGRIRLAQGDYQAAVEIFEGLLSRGGPVRREVFYPLGESYGKMQRLGPAHFYLGKHFRARGKLKKAVFHFERALKYLESPTMIRNTKTILDDLKQTAGKGSEKKS